MEELEQAAVGRRDYDAASAAKSEQDAARHALAQCATQAAAALPDSGRPAAQPGTKASDAMF